jgi:MFS transporter, DHA1 family, multidrug resistance protein
LGKRQKSVASWQDQLVRLSHRKKDGPVKGLSSILLIVVMMATMLHNHALGAMIAPATIMVLAAKMQMLPLPLFVTLAALMMFAFGLMFANFTSLAMEPQGHIAGTASSLYGSITTLLGIGIGTTIGQDYDGTLLPFATGFFLCTLASLAVVLVVEKGRLFKPAMRPVT